MPIRKRIAPRKKRRRGARWLFLEGLESRLAMDGSLTGFVFVDGDGDGMRDVGEVGLPGTVINLSGTDSSSNPVERSTLTQSDGSYRFDALDPGTYMLSERQPHAAIDGLDFNTVPGAMTGNDLVENIVLSDDQTLAEINFGEQGVHPGYMSITWFFASAPPSPVLLREAIATGEETAGDNALAQSIRDEASDVPPSPDAAPVAVDDSFMTSENTTLTISASAGVLANDMDANGEVLMATLTDQPDNGSVVLNADGSFVYIPDIDFTGMDLFTYSATDGNSDSNLATVTITVVNVADVTNTFSIAENLPVGTSVGTLDPEGEVGEPRIFEVVDATLPEQLRLAADDHISGDPAAPVVLIEYLDLQCPACAAVHSIVDQLEQNFGDDLLVVRRHLPLEGHQNAFAAARVAEAADRQDMFLEMVELLFNRQSQWESLDDPQSTFESYATELGLNLTDFQSDLDDAAIDTRINRDADAAAELGATGTPSFFLNGEDVSNPGTLAAFTSLVQAELDASDETFSVNRVTGEILVVDSAPLDFETTPTFNLEVSATNGQRITIDTVINLTNLNDVAPSAEDDTFNADADTVLSIGATDGVLANDSDADSTTLTVSVMGGPSNGTLSLNDDGSFIYTPNASFEGTDSFSYEVSDGDFIDTATVTIVVAPPNNAPVATSDVFEVTEGTTLDEPASSGLLSNDSDPDGDTIVAQLVDDPSNGTVMVNNDGSFSYTPNANFVGQDVFTYRVDDGTTLSDIANVSINVIAQNTFTVNQNAVEGTSVGQVTPEGELGSNVVFELEDSTKPAELELAPDDHMEGNPAAKVVLIEYLDLQCPFCAAVHPIVDQVEQTFPDDVLVVRRHFPLPIHGNAPVAANFAEAAGRQGMFVEMVDILFERQNEWAGATDPRPFFDSYATTLGLNIAQLRTDADDPAISSRVARDRDAANALSAPGTPTFFLNGQQIATPTTFSELSNLVTSERDAHQDPFVINRQTGELTVSNPNALATTPIMVSATATNGAVREVIDVTVNVSDNAAGEGEAAHHAVFAELSL